MGLFFFSRSVPGELDAVHFPAWRYFSAERALTKPGGVGRWAVGRPDIEEFVIGNVLLRSRPTADRAEYVVITCTVHWEISLDTS